MDWDLRKIFRRSAASESSSSKEKPLDAATRGSFMKDTAHMTPVSGMRKTWDLITAYWRSGTNTKPFEGWAVLNKLKFNPQMSAWALAGLIAGLSLADVALNVGAISLTKTFVDAMVAKDLAGMATQAAYIFGFLHLSALAGSTRGYLSNGLRLSWQGWLTDKFTKAYLLDKAFFHLHRNPGEIDNPDQRMSDDCEKLPGHLIGLGMGALNASTLLASCTYMMLLNVPPMAAAIGFAAAFTYAGLGTWLTKKVNNPLILLNGRQLQKDADFRSSLFNLRHNAAETAAYPSQDREKERLDKTFSKVVGNYRDVMRAQFYASFFGTVYSGTGELTKYGVGAVAYSMTAMTFGGYTQFVQLFERLRDNMSWFMTVYSSIVDAKVRIDRLTGLAQRIEDAQDLKKFYGENGAEADVQTHKTDNPSIVFENLRLDTPEGKSLIHIPHLEIKKGERVLIQGKSGCGKSTILRSMFDQWKYGSGDISMPKDGNIIYATQSPLVFQDATLRENLIHPYSTYKKKDHPADPDQPTFTDAQCRRALEMAGLPELIPFLDDSGRSGLSWKELSAGQKQMLVFARMFLMKYDVIVLDEATSALDPEMQEKLYSTLVKENPEATIVSIAHRSEIGRFHNRFLAVTKTGYLLESMSPPPDKPRQTVMAPTKALP